jgi:hypothetical protein
MRIRAVDGGCKDWFGIESPMPGDLRAKKLSVRLKATASSSSFCS